MMYPEPKYVKQTGEKIDISQCRFSPSKELMKFDRMINNGLSDSPVKNIAAEKKQIEDFCRDCGSIPGNFNNEAYGIHLSKDKITFYGSSDRSYYYAALALNEIAKEGAYDEGFLFDYPSMELRGIIEGFYGKPWTWEERHKAVEYISRHRMNTYIYAPKDDIYHRDKWFELYDAGTLSKLELLFKECCTMHVDFYYTISPGLSMEYSNHKHLELLVNKMLQLYTIGIRKFGILFDDIPKVLLNEGDRRKFSQAADAHAYIANMLYSRLKAVDSDCSLIVCPTVYHGNGDEEYIVRLCRGIPEDVDVFWTGREICSYAITAVDAEYFYRKTGHKPLYWDNYPVNDAGMTNEMHLGPICNRSADLHIYSRGMVSNVMEYMESSMIPITTVCHYLWNSEGYDKEKSLEIGIKEVAGEGAYGDFAQYIKYCSKSCLNLDGNEEYTDMMTRLRYAIIKGNALKVIKEHEKYFSWNLGCGRNLMKTDNKKLLSENTKWIKKWVLFCKFNLEVVRVLRKKYTGRRINVVDMLKLLLMYKRLDNNPIDIMKFETRVLFNSLRSAK